MVNLDASPVRPGELRCEFRDKPFGVDATRPYLSWVHLSGSGVTRSTHQTAYRILVASSIDLINTENPDLWDSEIVVSSSQHAYYGGAPLVSRQEVFWQVVADYNESVEGRKSDISRWVMGLLAEDDWIAQWITASNWKTPPEFTTKGFVTSEFDECESTAMAEIDLGTEWNADKIIIHPSRDEEGAPREFPTQFYLETYPTIDATDPFRIAAYSEASSDRIGSSPLEFNSLSRVNRFIRLVITEHSPSRDNPEKFRSVIPEMEVMVAGKNIALRRPTRFYGCDWFTGGATFLVDGQIGADVQVDEPAVTGQACSTTTAPMLRKSFLCSENVKQVTLHYAALGMAEVTINGHAVNDDVVGPPFTNYHKRVVYLSQDVTDRIIPGENVLGIVLGNGFHSPPSLGCNNRHGGQGPVCTLLQLEMVLGDGSRIVIATDSSWRWAPSEVIFNDLWDGYEENRELGQPGWNLPGFDQSDWASVACTSPLVGRLVCPMGPPVVRRGEVMPSRLDDNRAYFDFLSSGWPRLRVEGRAGQEIKISGSCGEKFVLPKMVFRLREDGLATLEPRFFFHTGPLELIIEGLDRPLKPGDVTIQCVGAALRATGSFECSNPWLNELHEVLSRTHHNYVFDHPLDPTREKQGWTQDAQGMFETAAYLTDVAGLYRKWWTDMSDQQDEEGYLGSIAPLVGRQVHDWNNPWWSGNIILLPWLIYQYYGDEALLASSYPSMERYLDFLNRIAKEGRGVEWASDPRLSSKSDPDAASKGLLVWKGAGDWLNPIGPPNGEMMATAGWFAMTSIVAQCAAILGKDADAEMWSTRSQRIRESYQQEFIESPSNTDTDLEQTSLVMALALGLHPSNREDEFVARLLKAVGRSNGHVGTGFVATTFLLQTLTRLNRPDVANEMINKDDSPGWKTLVRDGVLKEFWGGGEVQMPSCGGCVGAWMYQSVLGIRPEEKYPGFQRVGIFPQPDESSGLSWAKGFYRSVRGDIHVDWRLARGIFELNVSIPVGIAAIIVLSASVHKILESGNPLDSSDGVTSFETIEDQTHICVGSGDFRFVCSNFRK